MKVLAPFSSIWFVCVLTCMSAAPIDQDRKDKSLPYFEYIPDYQNYVDTNDEYVDYEENNLARTIPKQQNQILDKSFTSPIYYIRLPPQPYMFVPGLGYISQPAQPAANQFLNVPVSFVSNGKPGTIYQWSGQFGQFPASPVRSPSKTRPSSKPTDSPIHRLRGKYVFNGKPGNDVFVLGDNYNSLYGDALHNFYP